MIFDFFRSPVVRSEWTPYGTAYTVEFGGKVYGTSCDGTLWHEESPREYGRVSFSRSERLRGFVRRARRRGQIIENKTDRWDFLDGDPAFKAQIYAAGLKGRENAARSGLLP